MRFTIILLTAAFSQTYATGLAQNVTLSTKGMPLKQVFVVIEKQAGYVVFYNERLISKTKPVSLSANNLALNDFLKLALENQPLDYTIKGKTIVLSRRIQARSSNPLVSSIPYSTSSDVSPPISGTVLASNGEPLVGASISIKGSNLGVSTDASGRFSIQAESGQVLIISYTGYQTQEIRIGNRSSVVVSLTEDEKSLEGVVVVGYGTTTRKNLTTAISKVTPDNVSKAANSHMSQLLLGQASGLQATVSSAQPGGNVNVSIRGGGTPIYIVDGVMVPSASLEPNTGNIYTPSSVDRSGLAGLNPEDIESIEVLKDASASIYGIGAADGVILVTTKKGKSGPIKINYQGNISTVRNYDYPEPLDAQQYMNYVNIFTKELYLFNNKLAPYGTTDYAGGWSPVYNESEIANAQTTRWKDYALRNGSISNHTLTVNGGTKNLNYYVSGNYFKQKGQMVNSDMERYALKSTIVASLTSFLKLSAGLNFNYNNYLNSSVGGNAGGTGMAIAGALSAALIYPPNLPVRDETGKYTSFQTAPNPVGLSEISDKTRSNGSYLNFALDVDIIKNMVTAKLLYGNNLENSRRSTYIPSNIYFYQQFSPRGNLAEDHRMNQTMEATLMFNKKIFNVVNVGAVMGVGRYLNQSDGINISYNGGQYDAIGNDNISVVSGVFYPGSYRIQDEKRSQFVRTNFDILDRFVVSGTLRRDGTDKFFPDKKYALFPAVSLAWKISNESFLKDVSWINLLKVRASYGKTGSDNLGTSLYGTYGPSGVYVIFDNNTNRYMPIVMNGLDYPNVTWQKTMMKNVGVDFYLFNDRLSGSFDLFRNDITDMLGTANTAGLSMFATYPLNGGHQKREGWNATIQSKNISGSDFSWSSVLTLSKYKSMWLERMPNYDYNQYEIQGEVSTNAWYFYKTDGIVNAEKSNMPASQPASGQMPGYPIIVDKNGDKEITVADIEMTDNTPTLYWGLGNTFRYKSIDLNIFLYSKMGIYKYNYALEWADPGTLANGTGNANLYADRIWNSQTNPNGVLPGIATAQAPVSLPGGAGTDMLYQDASFVRVRNITLGYKIDGRALGAVGKAISSMRVFLDAQNPLTFTNFEGFDPEVNNGRGGASKGELPQARIYSAGISLSF